ncbi:MAG: SsrA-binding protein [Chlamydiae bacterium]|nr:SsrA-binding protein [Chlamydiota bacterium]
MTRQFSISIIYLGLLVGLTMTSKGKSELVRNRMATHNYEILERFEAGIALLGTEVKSLRENGGNLQESYVKIKRDELWLVGAHIAPFRHGNINNHEERRDRKLLLHKREIIKLKAATQEKGLALVPLSLYLVRGRVKLSVGKAKGLKAYDKRQKLKQRDQTRAVERELREN